MGYGTGVVLVRGRSVPWVDEFEAELRALGCAVITLYSAGEPTVAAVEAALSAARPVKIDVVVAVGGGAVIDLGKAVAAMLPARAPLLDHLESVGSALPLAHDPLPFIAVPTTSGTGAEVTKNAVIAVPELGRKVSLRDDRMIPDIAIIDPALTDDAPLAQTLASGLDALTQVIEPYVSSRANPLTDALCRAAIPLGAQALTVLSQGENAQARDDMAYVSLCGGLALANAGLGAVHGLAGVLGGRFGAPHGLICGRLMGPILAANENRLTQTGADTTRFKDVATWLGQGMNQRPEDIFDVLPRVLDQWGVARLGAWLTPQTALQDIAIEASGASSMKANPCVLEVEELVQAMRLAI